MRSRAVQVLVFCWISLAIMTSWIMEGVWFAGKRLIFPRPLEWVRTVLWEFFTGTP